MSLFVIVKFLHVLLAIIAVGFNATYGVWLARVARVEAEAAHALWIDLFPLMREQGRKGMVAADGLHPSADAYAEWARALATTASASSP